MIDKDYRTNSPRPKSIYVAAADVSEGLGQLRPDVPDASEQIGEDSNNSDSTSKSEKVDLYDHDTDEY